MKKIISLVLAVVMFACLLVPAMTANAATAYTYYVSSTGGDDGDGTEAKPFKDIVAAMDKAVTNTYAEGDTVKFIVVGEADVARTGVLNSSNKIAAQQWLATPSYAVSTGTLDEKMFLCVRDADGKILQNEDLTPKMIPITIEGKDASSKLVFAADASGAIRRYWCNEVVLKNITCTFKSVPWTESDKTIDPLTEYDYQQYLTASVAPVTYDNVKFDSSNGAKWRLGAEAFGGVPLSKMISAVPGCQLKNTVILKNGDYTGLDAVGSLYHYGADLSVNAAQIAALNPSLTIGAGAKVKDVIGLGCRPTASSTAQAFVSSNIIVENGGEVTGTIYGTNDGTEDKTVERKTPLNITVKSGAKVGEIKVVGNYVKLMSNITVTVEAGATCGTITEKGVGSEYDEGVTVTVDKQTASGGDTPAPNPDPSTPSTPATADAGEIVLFSFIALTAVAGVVVLKKTRA